MILYNHHSIFCKIRSKKGRDFKTDRGFGLEYFKKCIVNCKTKVKLVQYFEIDTRILKMH